MAVPNALFVIFAVSDTALVVERLKAVAPWLHLAVNEDKGEWLLIAPSNTTTVEVSERLGFGPTNPVVSGIVVRGDQYYGRAQKSIWEWIATKLGVELGTTANA